MLQDSRQALNLKSELFLALSSGSTLCINIEMV
jgi:hypothetical protein